MLILYRKCLLGCMKQRGGEGKEGDFSGLQGLPGPWYVLLRPLKNQLTPSPPFSLSICKSPLPVGHLAYPVACGVTSLLATLCSQADSTPGAVSQAAGPVHGGPASLGKQQWAPGRVSMAGHAEEENRMVFFPWLVWENSSALLCTLGCL